MSADRTLNVNGAERITGAADDTPLLDVLRNEWGLMATRFGCGAESCGACMVLIDDKPAYACTLPVDALSGKRIITLEGLGNADKPHPVQQAFLDEQAGQCGYCLSGIMISTVALLKDHPQPTRQQVTAALDKHLCRCGAHARILRAVERAAQLMTGQGARP
jgi:nicotinate dehydrogenase subunit A